MDCETVRQNLLDLGWDRETRQRAADVVAHLQTCNACREAAGDLDELRCILQPHDEVPPDGGWQAFENRIGHSLPRRHRLPSWVSGLAASLLLGALGLGVGRRMNSQTAQSSALAPVSTALSRTDISSDIETFEHLNKVFDQRASWVMLSDRSSDIGVGSSAASPNQPILLLRMTLIHDGALAHGGSDVVTRSDLVIIPGQPADLTIPLQQGQTFHYHVMTSTGKPTRLTMSADLYGADKDLLAGLATRFALSDDTNFTVGKLASNAGDYRLEIAFARSVLSRGGR